LISSGKVKFSGTPNFRQGMLIGTAAPTSNHGRSGFARPAWLREAGGAHAAINGPPKFTAQGDYEGIGYSFEFTPTSSTRLDISGTLCFEAESVCGNGPSTGLDAEVYLTGYLDSAPTTGSVTVNHGRVSSSSLSILGEHADLKMTYHITNHDGTESNPPVVAIPIGFGVSVPTEAGIPLYMRIQFVVAMSFGLAKGSTENGGVAWTASAGLAALKQAGATLTPSATNVSGDSSILDQSNGGVPISFAPTASGSAITFREKIGFGVGTTAVNAISYVDFIQGLGQEMGSAVVGQFCSSYDSLFSIGTGVEAQIGLGKLGLQLASTRAELFKNETFAEDPGCPQIGTSKDLFGPGLPTESADVAPPGTS
jgi:hypothetical protein